MKRTMKKFFKKTIKFLFDIVLMAIMLTSAQHGMNLPIGFAGIGCILIFGAVLAVYTYIKGKEYYKEGIKTGMEIQRVSDVIFLYADYGEDEFTIIAPNEIISNPYMKFLTHNILWHSINNNYYRVSSIINHGKETEVTFTKIKD